MKQKDFFLITTFVPVFFLYGCYGRYVEKGKRFGIKQKEYRLNDSLLLRNFMIYNTMDYNGIVSRNNMLWETDFDSLITVFASALEKQKLPVINQVKLGENLIDERHITKPFFNFGKLDNDWIISISNFKDTAITEKNLSKDILILVPLVYLYNTVNFTGFIGSGGVAGDNGFFVHTYFDIKIFIIKQDKIVYSKHIRFKSEKSPGFAKRYEAEANASAPMIKQEHWDEIVRLAMKDYMKRVK